MSSGIGSKSRSRPPAGLEGRARRRFALAAVASACMALVWAQTGHGATDLAVSDDGHYLVKAATGAPFLWKGDTAWSLSGRYDDAELAQYLQDRKNKGFTVVQIFATARWMATSFQGYPPYDGSDPIRLNTGYFNRVDTVIRKVGEYGLHAAVGIGEALRPDSPWYVGSAWEAYENGRLMGRRLGAHTNVIWIGGQDFAPTSNQVGLVRAQMEGLADGIHGANNFDGSGDYSDTMMTFHPCGGNTSATWFHGDAWLDFNMVQTWWSPPWPYTLIGPGYAAVPPKPIVNGEPPYEGGSRTGWGALTEYDARRFAYWSLFCGAFGHTYGHNAIWGNSSSWLSALKAPGCSDFALAMDLLASKPLLERVPDQSVLASGESAGAGRVYATRGRDGSYAWVYSPTGGVFSVRMDKLDGAGSTAQWFDPRTGASQQLGSLSNAGARAFVPPTAGYSNDWVLILEAMPPPVRLLRPEPYSIVRVPADVVLEAEVTIPIGRVSKVEFFADGARLGEAAAAPYRVTTACSAQGVRVFTARVLETGGQSSDSAPTPVTFCATHVRFVACNDLAWGPGQAAARVTRYSRGQSGCLTDFISGDELGAVLAVGDGGDGPQQDQGADAAAGTDAANVFRGRIDCAGLVGYSDAPLTLTVSNLDPTLRYECVLFGNRDVPAYTDRVTQVSLSGAAAFQNRSTAGSAFSGAGDATVRICNGWNTQRGCLARFAEIDPGSDGRVLLTVADGGSSSPPRFYVNAFALTATGAVQPPVAPANLTARAISSSRIDLAWADRSANEDAFKIDRRRSGTTSWVRMAQTAANVTACSDPGLPAATKFYYRVKASNVAGNSAYSAIAPATTFADALPQWVTYNDLAWGAGQAAANITRYTTTNGAAGAAWSGELVDAATGQGVGATLRVTGGDAAVLGQGANPAAGTDAAGVFGGKVDCAGAISYETRDLALTFGGLAPGGRYEAVVYSDRNNAAYTGAASRHQCARLDGAVSFTNASTAGTAISSSTASRDTTLYNAGYNAVNGYVTRFADISPGSDGSFSITLRRDSARNYYTYANAVMVRTSSSSSDGATGQASPPEDTDADGMADAWAAACLPNLPAPSNGPDSDPDGDGTSNLAEYVAGTDPLAGASWFAVEATLKDGHPVVNFQTVAAAGAGYEGLSRFYTLESCPSPDPGADWLPVEGVMDIAGAGQTVAYPVPAGSPAPLFFRVRVWLE